MMTKRIQIAPLKQDYQRIIDFDRENPADKIVVFVSKCDTEKESRNYKVIEDSLSNLGQYCQLTKIEFNMQVIDFTDEKSFLNVILDFAKSFLLDYKPGYDYMLNLGDDSLVLNIGLIQASQLIKAIYPITIIAHMEDLCLNEYLSFNYTLVSSFDALVSPPVTLRLLRCIDQNMNFKEIEEHYKMNKINTSLGTISNHINQMESLGIVTGKRVGNRQLTNLGHLVKLIFELKQNLV